MLRQTILLICLLLMASVTRADLVTDWADDEEQTREINYTFKIINLGDFPEYTFFSEEPFSEYGYWDIDTVYIGEDSVHFGTGELLKALPLTGGEPAISLEKLPVKIYDFGGDTDFFVEELRIDSIVEGRIFVSKVRSITTFLNGEEEIYEHKKDVLPLIPGGGKGPGLPFAIILSALSLAFLILFALLRKRKSSSLAYASAH